MPSSSVNSADQRLPRDTGCDTGCLTVQPMACSQAASSAAVHAACTRPQLTGDDLRWFPKQTMCCTQFSSANQTCNAHLSGTQAVAGSPRACSKHQQHSPTLHGAAAAQQRASLTQQDPAATDHNVPKDKHPAACGISHTLWQTTCMCMCAYHASTDNKYDTQPAP